MEQAKHINAVVLIFITAFGVSCSKEKSDIEQDLAPPMVARNEYGEIQSMKFVDGLDIDTLSWYAVGSRKFSTKSPDHTALMTAYCQMISARIDSNISSLMDARDQTNENHYFLEGTIKSCLEIDGSKKRFHQLNLKFQKAEKLISKRREEDKQANIQQAEESRAGERLIFSQTMRDAYLDEGMDIKVRVYGKNNTKIELTYILFNDVWSHKMKSGGIIQQLASMGFKKLEMTDGYDWAVYWDLNK